MKGRWFTFDREWRKDFGVKNEHCRYQENSEQKMQKSVDSFKNELAKIRTGRAHPGILDQVEVEYYGSMVPISQVANVTLLDARTISVQPWEKAWVPRSKRPFWGV